MPRHGVPPRGTLCLRTVYRGYTVPRHDVPPQGGYSMLRHRVPGGTRCLGTVYPPRGGYSMLRHRVPGSILCLGVVYPGVQGAGG